MDREFLKKKIECGVHRAKLRNIDLNNLHWLLSYKHGTYQLFDQKRAYILGMILEDRVADKNSNWEYDKHAALYLGTTADVIMAFHIGFCGSERLHNYKDDALFAFELGRKYRKELFI